MLVFVWLLWIDRSCVVLIKVVLGWAVLLWIGMGECVAGEVLLMLHRLSGVGLLDVDTAG